MRFDQPRKVSVVLGFAALLFLPLSLGSVADQGSEANESFLRTSEACAQSYICGYVPPEPVCPDDPYSDCEVGCDDEGLR